MRIGYFDCFNGASGDMILGALVAAGLPPDDLRADLARLNLADYDLHISDTKKQGFAATKVDVRMTGKPGHRHLHHVVAIIDGSDLPAGVKDRAKRVFTRLAEVEAAVHGSTIQKVHFHEVGAVDAIVDVVGAVAGITRLGLQRIVCSPIPVGSGTVTCDHGVMPVPAPATAGLLVGVPIAPTEETGELTTPTGAALLTTLADAFGPLPAMRIERGGFGAGTRDGKTRPNVLRLLIGESMDAAGDAESDEIILLEANVDDSTGEEIGHAVSRLLAAGALDAFTTPITMKKNRPGVMITALAPPDRAVALEAVFFEETSTFGVRRHRCTRRILSRRHESVNTPYGSIRVKVGERGGKPVTASPEYDDCAAAAAASGATLRTVMQAARAAWLASREARGA